MAYNKADLFINKKHICVIINCGIFFLSYSLNFQKVIETKKKLALKTCTNKKYIYLSKKNQNHSKHQKSHHSKSWTLMCRQANLK